MGALITPANVRIHNQIAPEIVCRIDWRMANQYHTASVIGPAVERAVVGDKRGTTNKASAPIAETLYQVTQSESETNMWNKQLSHPCLFMLCEARVYCCCESHFFHMQLLRSAPFDSHHHLLSARRCFAGNLRTPISNKVDWSSETIDTALLMQEWYTCRQFLALWCFYLRSSGFASFIWLIYCTWWLNLIYSHLYSQQQCPTLAAQIIFQIPQHPYY